MTKLKQTGFTLLVAFVFSIFISAMLVAPVEGQVTRPGGYWSYRHITTATTTLVKYNGGSVHCVTVGVVGAAASTIKLYDGAVTGANLVATIDGAATAGQPFCYDMLFNVSINVVTASGGAVPDVVVTWH